MDEALMKNSFYVLAFDDEDNPFDIVSSVQAQSKNIFICVIIYISNRHCFAFVFVLLNVLFRFSQNFK